MNLWIRSQGGTALRKITGVNITESDGMYYIEEYDTDTLGKYTTLARALKVLDDIVRCLTSNDCKLVTVTNGLGEYLNSYPNNVFVYQMPKE